MKAERRHELQTNTLALWLKWRAPEIWAKYGTHILLGIIVIALAVVLLRHLMNKPIEEANRAADALTLAREQIGDLSVGRTTPAESHGILSLIQQALDGSKRPEIQSEAQLTLGDYYWAMFNTPQPPSADTQPTISIVPIENPEEFLTKAEEAYNAALREGGSRPYVKARSQFGLAAVAEARGYLEQKKSGFKAAEKSEFWTVAKDHYQSVLDDKDTPQVLKDEAKWHLDQLAEAKKPIWLAPPPPASSPTTSTSGPTTREGILPPLPTSVPATRPK